MSAPDLSKLSSRMRYAADVLEEFNTDHPGLYQPDGWWRPSDLRKEAEQQESEELFIEEKAQGLARAMFDANDEERRPDGRSYPPTQPPPQWENVQHIYLTIARKLVADGWRREES